MDRINLHEPLFTQAQVLRCVPGLTAKTLQNWLAPNRRVIPIEIRPGQQGKIRWSGLQIVALAYMVLVVRLGIPPHASFALSAAVQARALHLHSSVEPVFDGKTLAWSANLPDGFVHDQLYVVSDHDGVYRQYFRSSEYDRLMASSPGAYMVIEVDRLILDTLSVIYQLATGMPADALSAAQRDAGVRPEQVAEPAPRVSRMRR